MLGTGPWCRKCSHCFLSLVHTGVSVCGVGGLVSDTEDRDRERVKKDKQTGTRERQKYYESAPDYRLGKCSDFFQLNQNFITQL